MKKSLPHPTWPPSTTTQPTNTSTPLHSQPCDTNNSTSLRKMVSENAVIVFGRRGCCMCHVVQRLLLVLGVNPTIFYVDEEDEEAVTDELSVIIGDEEGKDGRSLNFPAIFIGGKLFGGLERVMATHISGELEPILKDAGALWL